MLRAIAHHLVYEAPRNWPSRLNVGRVFEAVERGYQGENWEEADGRRNLIDLCRALLDHFFLDRRYAAFRCLARCDRCGEYLFGWNKIDRSAAMHAAMRRGDARV